jgi:hypothetical protein
LPGQGAAVGAGDFVGVGLGWVVCCDPVVPGGEGVGLAVGVAVDVGDGGSEA